MRIKKVRFKNGYKRFADLTIDLGDKPARFVALVGPNGCGKSSVLDGMLYHANAHANIGTSSNRDFTYHSMTGDSALNYRSVEIDFEEGPFTNVFTLRSAAGRPNTMFSFRSPYRYTSTVKVSETKSVEHIRLNQYGASDASSLDQKMEDNYRRILGKFQTVMLEEDLKPTEAKAKIIGELNTSIKNCLDLEISSLGNIETEQGTLYFTKSDHPKPFEFNVLSSGEKEVIDILLDLFLRKKDFDETVFLFDEPELHINTSIQRKLLVEIDRLVGEKCQIWITTHSIGFLRALQNEMRGQSQVIHFRPEDNLASQPVVLMPSTPGPALWRALFEIALDDLSNLIAPNKLIYCEGRAEASINGTERGLDAAVLNRVFGAEHPEAMFISSGGNTELDQRSAIAIAVLGKALPDLEIFLLKDRDMASGKITDDNDRQVYLDNNETHHRVLKRWEIENYLFDRIVLESYCSENGLIFNQVKYDKTVSDIKNENLKDLIGQIRAACGIKSSISPGRFKEQLASHIRPGMAVYDELESSIFY